MSAWPVLSYEAWQNTGRTLQLWLQIVGKVRHAFTPWINHGWSVPLYLTARGLGTGLIHTPQGHALELEFDLIDHKLVGRSAAGDRREISLASGTVAGFYREVQDLVAALAEPVRIVAIPNELPEATPFAQDHAHRPYAADAAHNWWRAMLAADTALKRFRTGFLGKASPVHLFWGAMDLPATRFSGRRAPRHPGGIPNLPDAITVEAYSHEVSSAGFWAGDERNPDGGFYAYAYPEPEGFRAAAVPSAATYSEALGEFLLPYPALLAASDPDALIQEFLAATYVAAAETGAWDRAELECDYGVPGTVRQVA